MTLYFQHDDEMYSERDRNDDYYNKKTKKPEQNYYQAKNQQQQQQQQGNKSDSSSSSKRYDSRQSEPRVMSNNSNYSYNHDSDKNSYDRSRGSDQKGGSQSYEHRNKPPTGPRINSANFKNLPMNIDSLPPRLKRKFLKECGLPEELADQPIMEIAQQSAGHSSTLPYRNRYDQPHRHQNFQNNNYQSKYSNNNNQNYHYNNDRGNSHHRSRSITPPRQQQQQQQQPQQQQSQQKQHYTPKSEWKSPNEKQQHDDLRHRMDKDGQSSFDWCEDVMMASSLPPEVNSSTSRDQKYDDNNRHRNRRRRNRR